MLHRHGCTRGEHGAAAKVRVLATVAFALLHHSRDLGGQRVQLSNVDEDPVVLVTARIDRNIVVRDEGCHFICREVAFQHHAQDPRLSLGVDFPRSHRTIIAPGIAPAKGTKMLSTMAIRLKRLREV